MTPITRDDFEFVSVGNWFSEYRCKHCRKVVVVSDDSDDATKPERWHECPGPRQGTSRDG